MKQREIPAVCMAFHKRLVVSCQADEGSALDDPEVMARFARAAVEGGAAGIRANGPENVRAIRKVVQAPIIGIQKSVQPDGKILITPSLEAARAVVEAGADLIAVDCTARGQLYGALERVRRIRSELGVPVMADIATVEEAVAAASAGVDLVATTMRGYTAETTHIQVFEPAFITQLLSAVDLPVVAEGHIATPEQAREAIAAGAFAVVVGAAITRPGEITRSFARMLDQEPARQSTRYILGIDLGGTRTKFGIVATDGTLTSELVAPTPAGGGRDVLLGHLKRVALDALAMAHQQGISPAALGVATAGWVNPHTGRVAYATENLPGWTGTPIADELQAVVGLPVAVENDANALAVAEKHFGLAKGLDNFVCITLGTGVGGGCYVGGRLNRGAHFFANALGHITIEHQGLPCTCGRKGCLEAYTNAAALLRYGRESGGAFSTAEELISAANSGHPAARPAIETYARYLATGIATIVNLLDPEMVILSGGIAQNNPVLLAAVEREAQGQVTAWEHRRLKVCVSQLGYHGGVLGAAGVALEKL